MSASPRTRVSAAERREELISAAVHEFARRGLHGTPVQRIAQRVGVAQPYVFSLFPSKLDLFLAALERGFEHVAETFEHAVAEYGAGRAPADCADALQAMGGAYKELLSCNRDYLMLQHQSYAACDDERVRSRVRHRYAELVALAQRLSGADDESIDDFFRHGMALQVAAALGVEDLSAACQWVSDELRTSSQQAAEEPRVGSSQQAAEEPRVGSPQATDESRTSSPRATDKLRDGKVG
ncbi:MAG TPA: TetR/AcrR family transcriptional regulator [Solirubrobacteraceae bacterium]|nr:TetR/AcrR family transcriptional regulator [Solirubrobacteraceae bacterium]